MDKNQLNRFQKFIELDLLEGCWLWKGSCNHDGYGKFTIFYKTIAAHRVAYEHWNGSIPDGLVIDHLCRNRNCVYPGHMRIVTVKENTNAGRNYEREKTICIRGHEFNDKNTYQDPNGSRRCKPCAALYQYKRRLKIATEKPKKEVTPKTK